MSEKISLSKNVFNKQQFKNTVTTATDTPASLPSIPSVEEFFRYYQDLFYTIPKQGEVNSHTYLVQTSQQYVGDSTQNEEIEALIQEVNGLRETVLEQQQLIFNLTSTTASNG